MQTGVRDTEMTSSIENCLLSPLRICLTNFDVDAAGIENGTD